jgi:uncharacterized protein YgiM (DUF1202 family)
MKLPHLLVLMLALFAGPALALESGTFTRDEILREKPKANAKVIGNIDKGVKAQLVKYKDNWYFVNIDNKWMGWVPVTSVRRTDSTFGSGMRDLPSTGGMPTATPGSAGSIPSAPGSSFHR